MITGTIKNAVKIQFLENKWQQKKNDINAKKPKKEMTQEERMLADFQERAEKERESNSHADLYNKLKSGGKLTSEEISYLEQNDPEALRKYREDQAEQKAYERDLKNCKTKDEAERVRLNKLGNFAAQAKKISTDPYIPLEKKVELMNQLNDKLCRVTEAHMEFLDSEQYKEMPTEAELSEQRTEEITDRQEDMQDEIMESVEDEPVVEEKESIGSDDEIISELNSKSSEEAIGINDTLTDSIRRIMISLENRDSRFDIRL